jgi:chaperonin GroES
MANITPLGNRVVVRLNKQKNVTTSGIILSSKTENEQSVGEITSIGGGIGEEENVTKLGLTVGDTVVFGKYSGEEIKDDQDSETVYKVVNGKDIIAILEK